MRKFNENDIGALFLLLKDEEVNAFLPWFPAKTIQDAERFYRERYEAAYVSGQSCAYAVCLKADDIPIGYIKVDMDESHDFGYALRKEFWHKGIAAEAGKAVVELVRNSGLPYITATHDVNNPRSGGVMKQVGMKYMYSYEENWQPKNFKVVFRMYQLNFDGVQNSVFRKYWDKYKVHFIEENV